MIKPKTTKAEARAKRSARGDHRFTIEPFTVTAANTIVETVKMKRLTLDLSEDLHRAIKLNAVQDGVTMAEKLRELLSEHYGIAKSSKG
jgi:predicted DNA binding CopG/RHH family protein